MFKGDINAYEVTLSLMWSRDKRAWSGTWGQYNRNSWKDNSLDSKRYGNGLFLFSFFPSILQWPKSGIVNSNGAPELNSLCFLNSNKGVHSASLLQKEHFLGKYMGCQACGRLLSHIWFTDLASEIFRFLYYSTGWSVSKLLVWNPHWGV